MYKKMSFLTLLTTSLALCAAHATAGMLWFDSDKRKAMFWSIDPWNNLVDSQRELYERVGYEWTLKGFGDVNGDGDDDLLWQHQNGQVHAWLMRNGARIGKCDIHSRVGGE